MSPRPDLRIKYTPRRTKIWTTKNQWKASKSPASRSTGQPWGPPEHFKTLFRSKSIKVELITSKGHATPAGQWLVSRKNEWVMLLAGGAALKFKSGRLVRMKKGSHVLIPAGKSHRVQSTSAGVKTVWLAIHF